MIKRIDNIADLKEINFHSSLISKETMQHELEMNPFGHYLLDIEENSILGYLYYSDIYDRAEINQIEVEVLHRNCGKASNLLRKMIFLVEKDITLEVKKDNIPAINLYKKFGFENKAIRKGYYHGIDGILMERKQEKV